MSELVTAAAEVSAHFTSGVSTAAGCPDTAADEASLASVVAGVTTAGCLSTGWTVLTGETATVASLLAAGSSERCCNGKTARKPRTGVDVGLYCVGVSVDSAGSTLKASAGRFLDTENSTKEVSSQTQDQ